MEKIFYENADLRITDASFTIGGTKVPIEDVALVEQRVEEPARLGLPTFLIASGVVGVVISIARGHPAVTFLLVLGTIVAGLWETTRRATFTVSIVKPGGNSEVVATQDKTYASAVLRAAERAIAAAQENRRKQD